MFEDQQEMVEDLLTNNPDFKSLYDRHQELKAKVRDADLGVTPMDSLALDRLKKEKLLLKDRMAVMISSHQSD